MHKMNLPYTGVMTFGKLPLWDGDGPSTCDAVFLGAPYDLGSLNRPGARYGPRALRDAYTRSKPFFHVEFDRLYLDGLSMADAGDVDMPYPHADACLANVRESVSQVVAAGALCAVLGGDHSVTVPAVAAHAGGDPLFVVSLSAHLDFSDDGDTVSEDTVSRSLSNLPHVAGMAHIGVRGPVPKEDVDAVRTRGHGVWSVRNIKGQGWAAVMEGIPGDLDCYVTVDCSVFDPGRFSGSTRPAPGGLDFVEISDFLRLLATARRVRGFDLTGYTPLWDREAVSAQTAGRIALDLVDTILH